MLEPRTLSNVGKPTHQQDNFSVWFFVFKLLVQCGGCHLGNSIDCSYSPHNSPQNRASSTLGRRHRDRVTDAEISRAHCLAPYTIMARFGILFLTGLPVANVRHSVHIPGAPLTNFNHWDREKGGWVGVRQRFIFYTQKIHNFRICLPITTFFLAYPNKSLSLFFAI